VMWEPIKDIQVFTDLTRSHDIPDFSDLVQTGFSGTRFVPLEAQKAWTFEIGSRGVYDRLKWDVTYYRSNIRDELLNFNPNAALGVPAATFNSPRTLHQGIELGVGVDVLRDISGPGAGDTLSLAQIWTHNDFRFRNDPVFRNNQIAGAPPDVLRTALSYTRPDGFYITPALDWVPQGAFADHANTLRVPGYTLIGVQTGINFKNGVSVFVDARNLADKRFVSDISVVADARVVPTTIFYPGDGRSVFAGIRYTF
jgi:iron complex outermembrane receptor protein